jgi:small subunit ribosomal protein S5
MDEQKIITEDVVVEPTRTSAEIVEVITPTHDTITPEEAAGTVVKVAGRFVRSADPRARNPRAKKFNQPRERVKPEFDQKIIDIRRVARVVAGGRRFSFSVSMIVGNRKGQVGVGLGKGSDTQLAIDKAMRDAKKHLIKIPFTKTFSIPHDVEAKYSSARVMIMPAKGKGLVAGGPVRTVLELAGVKDVGAKIFSGSKNRLNNAQAAIKALSQLKAKKVLAPIITITN